ncbi:MAG: DUF1822 family protein, partial [Coleofasciculaceae cyanobacterium SM2_3_26]|nr:DUF1822 family protein [Coleofasciculaceae cyanobacterium SM2_3_26]
GDWGAILERADWRQRLCALRRGTSPTILANLATWLADRVEAQSFEATDGWQSIETLFPNYRTLATGLRRTRNLSDRVRRVKLLHFGTPPEPTDMVLSVEVAAEPDNRLGIRVQLHPGGETPYLPEQTVLSLLGKDEAVLQSVQARSQDNFIQIQRFKCPPGTPFSLRVEWSGQSIVEAFTS